MKYLFHIFNIACLTATMFLVVETLYNYLDGALMGPDHTILPSGEKYDINQSSGGGNYSGESPAAPLLNHYEIIHKRDIFRTSGEVAVPEDSESLSEKAIASLAKTGLKLKLWGTVTGGEESEHYAVVETDKDKRQLLYRNGDKIEDALIKKILRFSIILSRNGKDELLEITEESLSEKRGGGKTSGEGAKGSPAGESEDKLEVSIKRSLIEDSMNNINELMSQVRAKPHFTGGNADGILLYGIKQNSMFKDMGIQNGDVIMGVDGTEIKSVEDTISLYDKLKNSQDVKMQIRRRGQVKEILYHVE